MTTEDLNANATIFGLTSTGRDDPWRHMSCVGGWQKVMSLSRHQSCVWIDYVGGIIMWLMYFPPNKIGFCY
jgi:hypothetical protein